MTFCGMSACIDATVSMGDMLPLIEADAPPEAVSFARLLKDRAARGVGGEIRVEWPEGPAWLRERLHPRYSLGGTGPHASWVLSTLEAPAILNLEDRSRHMLSQLPPGVLLAEGDGLVPSRRAGSRGTRRANIFIFEYTAGVAVGDVVPSRSTRIIVRFDDPGLEHDEDFDAYTRREAAAAGSGLVAGFSAIGADALDAELERVFGLTRSWANAGLSTIHLEMSGFDVTELRDRVLDAIPGSGVTSIGMSQSEFVDIRPDCTRDADLPAALAQLGVRLGLRRVCAHADHWAASVTLDDPGVERDALLAGCLLASARAAAGRPVVPDGVPTQARFEEPPFASASLPGGWNTVVVPSPYLDRPVTTLGLGDTFTAGCLLVLGAASKGIRFKTTRQ